MYPTPQWHEVEIALALTTVYENPYTDVDVVVEFTHESGDHLVRPAFWDGGQSWKVRFTSPRPGGTWSWRVNTAGQDQVTPGTGAIEVAGTIEHRHPALTHGFLRVAPGARALVHADGTPALVVADTPWAMPWRARLSDVTDYVRDRSAKGFNAALLMTVQPDMRATGPRGRNTDLGFERGFEDLPTGHLNEINVDYFTEFDAIITELIDGGITPVLQPVFHGFGWKGLDVAGPVVPPAEYARYCRYLVARYGARPAFYLVGADGAGTEPQIEAGGREVQRWDAYGQPTGIHYRPHARAQAHQDAEWLDFQWCQSGHEGEHVPERLADMWRNEPPKPAMNAEPTYEHSGRRGKGEGWWQGHEAWSNLCAGGTMGVAYGAGSLWQWRISPEEGGHQPFFLAENAGWREALAFEGSAYVGLVGRILAGLPTTELAPCWDVSLGTRGLLDPGVLYLGYLENGGRTLFLNADGRVPIHYWLIDPRTAQVVAAGERPGNGGIIDDPGGDPRVLICYDGTPGPLLRAPRATRPASVSLHG